MKDSYRKTILAILDEGGDVPTLPILPEPADDRAADFAVAARAYILSGLTFDDFLLALQADERQPEPWRNLALLTSVAVDETPQTLRALGIPPKTRRHIAAFMQAAAAALRADNFAKGVRR